jgi:hypothetical protein
MNIINENLKFLGVQAPDLISEPILLYAFSILTLALFALISFINILIYFSFILKVEHKYVAEEIAKRKRIQKQKIAIFYKKQE